MDHEETFDRITNSPIGKLMTSTAERNIEIIKEQRVLALLIGEVWETLNNSETPITLAEFREMIFHHYIADEPQVVEIWDRLSGMTGDYLECGHWFLAITRKK